MNKRILICLLTFALLFTLAFSVSAVCMRAFPADAAPPFEDGNWNAEPDPGALTVDEEGAQKQPLVKSVLICAVIGLVIALIVTLSVKSSYKAVRRKRDAAQYLVDGSLRITGSSETFVRSETSERTIENKNQS